METKNLPKKGKWAHITSKDWEMDSWNEWGPLDHWVKYLERGGWNPTKIIEFGFLEKKKYRNLGLGLYS